MKDLNALTTLLAQLRNYEDGARLKAAAMKEVTLVLDYLELSRRKFVQEATRLGVALPSPTSLSNWINCTHIPSAENVDRLLEAVQTVLHEHGHSDAPWETPLRESSFMHNHNLQNFRRNARNLEQAKGMLDATIAWLDVADFPPTQNNWPGSFVPLTREHGIQCLEVLRSVHLEAAENTTAARAVEHELLAAKASIVLAHNYNICGRYARALEVADEGTYSLNDILTKYPAWRKQPIDGHTYSLGETVTLGDIEIVGLGRKAAALHALSQLAKSPKENGELSRMVIRTLTKALERAASMPEDRFCTAGVWRTWAVVDLDNAATSLDLEHALAHAERAFAQLRASHSRVSLMEYYVTRLVEMEAHARLGKIQRAADLLAESEQVEQQLSSKVRLQIGPTHRLIYWRSLSTFWWARAQEQPSGSSRWREYGRRWRDAVHTGMGLAHETGLHDQARRFDLLTQKTGSDFRRLLATHRH